MQLRPFTPSETTNCVRLLRARFDTAEVLHRQRNKMVLRLVPADRGDPLIAKLWQQSPLATVMRRALSITPAQREWRGSLTLARAGVPVPHPYGRAVLSPNLGGYDEVLFMEDLGDCELSTDYLKRLIRAGDEARVVQFEDALIEMMERILAAGIVDVDHGMANVVVQRSGRAVRLDFELARRLIWPRLPIFTSAYGEMLGRFIGLHAFAVQPDMARNTRLAFRVRERLRPPQRVLEYATAYAAKMMQKQLEETGIETRLRLPWVR